MIGLFMIFVMGVVLALHIIVPILFSKLGKDNGKKRLIFGALGFLIVFSIFFGDHVVRKIYFNYLCMTKTKYVLYDRTGYNEYLNKKIPPYKSEFLDKTNIKQVVAKYNINFNADYGYLRGDRYVLFFSEDSNNVIKDILFDTKNKNIIYEEQYPNSIQGGWFCQTINIVNHSCPITYNKTLK